MSDSLDFDIYGDTDFILESEEDDSKKSKSTHAESNYTDDVFAGLDETTKNEDVSSANAVGTELNKSDEAPAAGTSGTTTGKNEVTPTLSVSGINWWTTEDELRDIISVVGVEKNIKEIAFRENKINGKSLGAVNIEFIDIESSEKAKAKLTQLKFSGNPCTVTFVSNTNTLAKSSAQDNAPRKPIVTSSASLDQRYLQTRTGPQQIMHQNVVPMGSMAMRNVNVMGMNYRMPMGMPMGGMPIANPAVQMQMMGSMPFMNPMRPGIPMQQSGMHMGTIGGVGGVGQFKPASQSQPATPQSSSSTQIVGQKRKPTEHLPDDRGISAGKSPRKSIETFS